MRCNCSCSIDAHYRDGGQCKINTHGPVQENKDKGIILKQD